MTDFEMNYRDRGDWSGTFESNLDNGRWVKYDYVENLLKEKDEQIEEMKKLKDKLNTVKGLLGEADQLIGKHSRFNDEILSKWRKSVNKCLRQGQD